MYPRPSSPRLARVGLSAALALLVLALFAPRPALAVDDAGADTGAFAVSGGTQGTDYTYADGVLTITGGSITVANTDPSTPVQDRIVIQGEATVTFAGLNITVSGADAPVTVDDSSGTAVTILLRGENTLRSTGGAPALRKSDGQTGGRGRGTLKITSSAGDGSTSGLLVAEASGSSAAGIGASGYHGDVANLEIAGGTIAARAGSDAADIGSTRGGSVWNLVISGGSVTATGSRGIGTDGSFGTPGSRDSRITGGIVSTRRYDGAAPTGGIVSTDGGATWRAVASLELPTDFEIPSGSTLLIPSGVELSVGDGVSLVNNGIVECSGSISGMIENNGDLWCGSGVEDDQVTGTGSVNRHAVEVTGGSGSGVYQVGDAVSIQASDPGEGRVFAGWVVRGGTAALADPSAERTTFTMPDGFARIEATYRYVWGTVTTESGETVRLATNEPGGENVRVSSDDWSAYPNSTLTLNPNYYDGTWHFALRTPSSGLNTLDLSGMTVFSPELSVHADTTILDGTLQIFRLPLSLGAGSSLTTRNVRFEPHWQDHHSTLFVPPNSTFTNAGNTTFVGDISLENEGTVHTTHDDSFDYGGTVIKDQHTFDRQVAEGAFLAASATCTDPAQYWYSCSCGARGTETFASGGPLGHAWASTSVVPPTETEQGYTIYTCDRCGLTEQRDFVPATGQDDDPGQGEGGAGTGESRPGGGTDNDGIAGEGGQQGQAALPATGEPAQVLPALAVAGCAIVALGLALTRDEL
ncbi:MAG TPA: hypothetical protein IAA40_03710 [Candidatus Olsenella excrementigallinarum]|nr:hypothetical protein [Candidatus Olsenella excrementigallinarum]